MEQTVKVVKCNEDGTARVVCTRESACSGDCHKCTGCGAVAQTLYLTARNPIDAKVGDTVIIHTESAPVLAAAALLYLLPLVLFLGFYTLGQMLWAQGLWLGLGGFLMSMLLAVCYDRFVLKKTKTLYTIVDYSQKA